MRLELRYLSEERDRHGNVRIYFRYDGRRVRIREALDTPEFHERYRALLEMARTNTWAREVRQSTTGATDGTLGWLALRYRASSNFRDLDRSTQRARTIKMEAMLNEAIRPGAPLLFRDLPVSRITTANLAVLRDRKRNAPHSANDRVKILRGLCRWAASASLLPSDPSLTLHKIAASIDGHHTWTEMEIERFEETHPVGTKARLALALLLYTGARRSDVVRLGRPHYIDGRLRWTAAKNRNRAPVVVDIPVLPPLQAILDSSPLGAICYLENDYGRPFTVHGFGARMAKWSADAGLTGCTAHGLRKAGSTRAAEAGATAHQLMAMFGWRTLAEAERYTRSAERKRMATVGMALVMKPRT